MPHSGPCDGRILPPLMIPIVDRGSALRLVGRVIDEGRRRGLTVPLNERLVRQVKEIERGTRQRGLHNLGALADLRQELSVAQTR
jgi:hypothetical protein